MRLSDEERRVIRDAVVEVYGPAAIVRLFGSRVHDHLRGGDIDLHVEADDVGREQHPSRKDRLWAHLQQRLGDRRIDIIQSQHGRTRKAVEAAAYAEGVIL